MASMEERTVDFYVTLEHPTTDEAIEFYVVSTITHDPGDWVTPPYTEVEHEVQPSPVWELTQSQWETLDEEAHYA